MDNIKMNKLIFPVFIELTLQMFVGNVDQLMLSQYSDTAVSAVGNANMIMSVVILVFNVISTATSILVSQSIGANDMKRVGSIYTLAVFVNGILGMAFMGIIYVTIRPIYSLMQVPAELIEDAVVYIQIVALSIPIQALIATFSAIFRSNALMKTTMKISLVYNIINIIGNQILIKGLGDIPAMGTAGVAISTVVSRLVGLVIMMGIFKKVITNAEIDFKLLKPFPKDILRDMLKIGIPTGGENFSWNLAQLVSLGIINTFGTASITARTYVNMV
ncbi:MAG: MATE family efflux transporter, partial [Oscillospiraceae bacterium]